MDQRRNGAEGGARERRGASARLVLGGLLGLGCGLFVAAMGGAASIADTLAGAPIVKNSARLLPSGGVEDRAPAYTGSITKRNESLGAGSNGQNLAAPGEPTQAAAAQASCTELVLNRQHGSTRARPCVAQSHSEAVGSQLRTAHRADWQ